MRILLLMLITTAANASPKSEEYCLTHAYAIANAKAWQIVNKATPAQAIALVEQTIMREAHDAATYLADDDDIARAREWARRYLGGTLQPVEVFERIETECSARVSM